MTNQQYNLFATAPKGLELLLVEELKSLGATQAAEKLAGVTFTGDLTLAYKACLWSRLANRILLFLTRGTAETPEQLYQLIQTINWDQHLHHDGSLSVQFVSSQSEISHTLFGAQKVKDAIVDQMRDKHGVRPNVAKEQPDVSVYVYLHRNEATIYIDLSGESLHRRGYRIISGSAPLKENLAAAILLRAGWPLIAKQGGPLVDPLCGSGTLLIEAAMMAGDIAPGLKRDYYGFLGWQQHQDKLWHDILMDAQKRCDVGMKKIPTIVGYDHDPISIKIAFENIERAEMRGKIHVEKRELATLTQKPLTQNGLLITNPPYGERLGDVESLQPLYSLLGEKLKQEFVGWQAAVFTGNPDLGKQMGIKAKKYYAFFNGAIPCKLLLFDVEAQAFVDRSDAADNERRIASAIRSVGDDKTDVQMFINRLQKNLRKLNKKILDNQTPTRIYDADIPEYAFAIDVLNEKVHVYEYQAPKFVPEKKVLSRRQQVLAVLPGLMAKEPANIFFSVIEKPKKEKN